METTKTQKIIYSLKSKLFDLHFYTTKAEGIFKLITITASWCISASFLSNSDKIQDRKSLITTLYLFSLSIITEFVVKLVSVKRFIKKIIPTLIVVPAIIIHVCTFAETFGGNRIISDMTLKVCLIFFLVIIWIDILIQILVEKPLPVKVDLCKMIKDIDIRS